MNEPVFAESIVNNVVNPQNKPPEPPQAEVENTGVNNIIQEGEEELGQQQEQMDAAATQKVPNRRPKWKNAFLSILGFVMAGLIIGGIALATAGDTSEISASANTITESNTQKLVANLQNVSANSSVKLDETKDDEITFEPEVSLETVNNDLNALHGWVTKEVHPRMQKLVDRAEALEKDTATLKKELASAQSLNSTLQFTLLVLGIAFFFLLVYLGWAVGNVRRKVERLTSPPGPIEDLNPRTQG